MVKFRRTTIPGGAEKTKALSFLPNDLLPKNLHQMKTLQSIIGTRLNWMSQMGVSYGGKRNLYQALGYPKTINFEDYYAKYRREGIAKTLVEKAPDSIWSDPPVITDDAEESKFENEVKEMAKKFKLYSVMKRADILMRLSYYSVTLLGFNDIATLNEMVQPVAKSGSLELLYLQPYSFIDAKIHKVDNDIRSERFNQPEIYQVRLSSTLSSIMQGAGGRGSTDVGAIHAENQTVLVHHTRILHHAEGALENEFVGTPYLESLYNRLEDIEKILGGSGEMFWRGALPGHVAKADENYTFQKGDKDDIMNQLDEYENNLRRWLTFKGITIDKVSPEVVSPKDFLDAQLNMAAIISGIPKRIFMGSERGELASTQDQDQWNNILNNRREQVCEPEFLMKFVDRMLELGIIKNTPEGDEYAINWTELTSIGQKDRSEILQNRSSAMKAYVESGSDQIMPFDLFLKYEMGYEQDVIDEIIKMRDEEFDQERKDFEEERAAFEEERDRAALEAAAAEEAAQVAEEEEEV